MTLRNWGWELSYPRSASAWRCSHRAMARRGGYCESPDPSTCDRQSGVPARWRRIGKQRIAHIEVVMTPASRLSVSRTRLLIRKSYWCWTLLTLLEHAERIIRKILVRVVRGRLEIGIASPSCGSSTRSFGYEILLAENRAVFAR